MPSRVFRFLRELLDVDTTGAADGDVLEYDAGTQKWIPGAGGGGGASAAEDVSFTPAGSVAATDVQAAIVELDTEKAASTHAHSGADITSGTVAEARIDAAIARDSEVTSAISALSSVYQPLDSDLTSIAALTTTAFGRGLLALADAAALLAAAGAAAATHAHSGDDITSGTVADARIASTIARDSEVTAAVSAHESDTTSVHGIADTSALLDSGDIGATVQGYDADLGTIAGLAPSNDDVLQRKAGAWTNRTIAQLLTDLAAPGTTFQPLDSDLTSIASLTTTSFGRGLLELANAAALLSAAGAAASSHTHAASDLASGQVALARGGTAANLADPGADRIMFWDDSAGAVDWLTAGSGLTITGTSIAASGSSDPLPPYLYAR